jgi:hypothetical protein
VRSPRARELLQGVHVRVSGSTRARNGDSSFYEAMHKLLKLLSASQVSESAWGKIVEIKNFSCLNW